MIKIAVLGSGFGGMEAVLNLEERFHRNHDVEITLVSNNNFTLFTPLLPQIVSSYIEPRHIIQTVRDIRRDKKFRFIRDSVIGINLIQKLVKLSQMEISYDYLVITLGSITNYFNVLGAENYTFALKTLEDSAELRDHIIDILEHADQERDLNLRREMLTFVIVGGGYTGVELTAELRDFIYRYVVKKYRGINFNDIKIMILEADSEILGGVDPDLAKRAQKKLIKGEIEIKTNSRVTRCFESGVEINNLDIIKARIMIWTAGVRASPVLDPLTVRKGKFGRILVNDYLQIPEFPEAYAIGDNAIVEGENPMKSSQPIAPVAIHQGRIAAKNIINSIENKPLGKYLFSPSGMLVSLGMNDAVINIKGIKIAGFIAWLLWNAIHLLKLVGIKKQIQVALDWSLSSIFPRDSGIIRLPKRCRICAKKIESK
jgi:NADH dehydrogenase